MLIAQQEAFCRNIIDGYNATESYKRAYNTDKHNIAKVEAYKLLQNKKIQDRLTELTTPILAEQNAQNSTKRAEMIDFIQSRIEVCKNNQDENNIVRYTDMLNKIYGTYKVEQDNIKSNSNLHNLSMDKLQKIVEFDVS